MSRVADVCSGVEAPAAIAARSAPDVLSVAVPERVKPLIQRRAVASQYRNRMLSRARTTRGLRLPTQCLIVHRRSKFRHGVGCTHPRRGECQFVCEAILLVAAHLVRRYARQAVALIQRGEAVLIRFQGCGPVPGEKALIPADPVVFCKLGQKIEGYVDVNVHVGIVLRPVQKACTLRNLVPHHAVIRILIPVEKGEFVSSPLVVALMQQRLSCYQTISSKVPGVLWTARRVRRSIAGD